ncbi:hypothetical protein PAGU2595_002460 [Lysobacter xanthus]
MSRLIEQEFPAGEMGVCLSFFSADHDGATTDTLLMLANSLQGELGSRVLMVDARFRDPAAGLTGRLGMLSAPGFAEIMRGGLDGWSDSIRKTALDRVDVLPAGLLGPSDALSLDRDRWTEFLARAAGRYRHVLIQTSSVLADTRSLLAVAQTDAVFLVVQENLTLMNTVADIRHVLLSNGVEDLRVVLSTPEQ